jgi:Coenzyme PQQ synthesis protein D (PqqD)
MDPEARFRVNSQIIWETIEGEVLLINLGTGNYYSLRGTGAAIWNAVERGARVSETLEFVERAYEGEHELEAALIRFLEEVVAEELVIPIPPDGEETTALDETILSDAPFETPVLEKFTDMQDLVLLDPVHDIDSAEGWPRTKPQG